MLLICYDGSEDAKAAIEHAGKLMSGQPATVLTVWQPVAVMGSRAPTAFMFLPTLLDSEEIDQANEGYAAKQAEQGAALARAAGLDAAAMTHAQTGSVADAILAEAERLQADAILMGSRGLTGLKSILLGSVSHAVLQHACRPVIVVPSPKVALSRTEVRRVVSEEVNSTRE